MTKVFNTLKKTLFLFSLGSFSQFLEQIKISKKITLSCTSSHGFLATCENTEKKLKIQFQENVKTGKKKKGRMKG